MKRGLNTNLEVSFDTPLEEISKIEFVFTNTKGAKPIKKATYPNDADKSPDKNSVIIHFTSEETYKFENQFYLDTRITLKSTNDQPETPIIQLNMNDTLFEEENKQ